MTTHPTPRALGKAFALAGFLAATVSVAPAQTIKVLFWGGPATSSHNVPAFRDTIVPYLTNQGMTVTYRQNDPYPWIHADSLAQYDVMLLYTTNQDATDLSTTQIATIANWLSSGRVMVALHGTTNTFINGNASVTSAWRALLGAQYTGHGPLNTSGTVSLTNSGTTHASLQGTLMLPQSGANTGDSPYWDEGREHINFASDTIVLGRSQTASSNFPWIWVRPQGNGWVYYNASGHDNQVWRRLEFKSQILRALQWGNTIKTTGLAGRKALQALVRTHGNEIIVPMKPGYALEVTDLQGRRVYHVARGTQDRHDLGFLAAGLYGVTVTPARNDGVAGGDAEAPARSLFVKRAR